jgi:O-antigen/teichoic acid export membrane protein
LNSRRALIGAFWGAVLGTVTASLFGIFIFALLFESVEYWMDCAYASAFGMGGAKIYIPFLICSAFYGAVVGGWLRVRRRIFSVNYLPFAVGGLLVVVTSIFIGGFLWVFVLPSLATTILAFIGLFPKRKSGSGMTPTTK